jgi:hypothetical protein
MSHARSPAIIKYYPRGYVGMVISMNSKDLVKRGFSEPVDLREGGQSQIPSKIGVYVIIRKDKEIDYPMGKSDIVKIGKCEETGKGFTGRWCDYISSGTAQDAGKRPRQGPSRDQHAFSWLELPKNQIKQVEKRLLNEFVRFHGQYPPFNLTH